MSYLSSTSPFSSIRNVPKITYEEAEQPSPICGSLRAKFPIIIIIIIIIFSQAM